MARTKSRKMFGRAKPARGASDKAKHLRKIRGTKRRLTRAGYGKASGHRSWKK